MSVSSNITGAAVETKNEWSLYLGIFVLFVFCVAVGIFVTGCSEKTSVYGLSADENHLAEVNARQWYEKPRIDADGQRGQWISCRPSDSNSNGMVSCFGKVPTPQGWKDVKMYCGYKPELAGCSDEDTVPK